MEIINGPSIQLFFHNPLHVLKTSQMVTLEIDFDFWKAGTQIIRIMDGAVVPQECSFWSKTHSQGMCLESNFFQVRNTD